MSESQLWSNLPLIMSSLNVNTNSPSSNYSPPSMSVEHGQAHGSSYSTSAMPKIDANESPVKRSLPSRLAKQKGTSILKLKRVTIMKPRKLVKDTLSSKEVKKLYLENKVAKNFRPTNLETIFEDPIVDTKLLGGKKIKRSLSCSDGLNHTKATIKNRRQKIKKTLGRRFALKKISLDDFLERLNASFEKTKQPMDEEPCNGPVLTDYCINSDISILNDSSDGSESDGNINE